VCGIAGFLDRSQQVAGAELERLATRMADALRHRGPDDAGAWADEQAGIALGFRRLAILDLTAEGHQPMHSAGGRYVIIFNGEIYNFQALRAELEALGHGFRGRSDTEVMLAAIEEWGVASALERFNGMFAFALWDRQRRELTLARDRLGEKPLYYGWMGHVFVFGSELDALRTHPAFREQIDGGATALYLRHNYVPAPYSIYRGTQKLPPATYLTLSLHQAGELPAPTPYWSLRTIAEQSTREPSRIPAAVAVAQLDALLRDAVALRMVADVPLGAFLSGGIDSSTVVALMQSQSGRPVKTFTIGFGEEDFDEAAYARAVALHLGTDHTELYVTPAEAMAVIPRLPKLYDEPFSDPSQIPTCLVSALARQNVTVSLSGDGGDELFGGYDRYSWAQWIWRGIGWMPLDLRRVVAKALTVPSPSIWDAAFDRLAPILPQRLQVSRFGDRLHKLALMVAVERPETMYRALISHWKEPSALLHGLAEPDSVLTDRRQWARLHDLRLRLMYLDTMTYLPDDILVKIDRASMAVGLEARVPLLDHRVVEFAWQIPLHQKIRHGQGKWLLRQVLYRYVPRSLIERPKMGFGVPVSRWLRGPLREWADDLLSESSLSADGIFDPRPIRACWREHLSGQRNWGEYIWDVLMFQTWKAERSGVLAPS
jgi:asparagine synthase (glutamine-hydrolysing)